MTDLFQVFFGLPLFLDNVLTFQIPILVTFFGPKVDNIPSVRFLLREVSITNKFKKCELAHSSRVLWWNSHLSLEHLRVFHLVWNLLFDLFGLGGPTSSYATADIALRVIGAHKPHHHYKVEAHGEKEIQENIISGCL
jgi:hypothetical protein